MMLLRTLLLSSFLCCFLNSCRQNICVYNTPRLIMTERLGTDSNYVYWDYVLADSLQRECLDSSRTMQMVNAYLANKKDSVITRGLSILTSTKGYDAGKKTNQPEAFYNNIIVEMFLDTASGKPERFIFYDNNHLVNHDSPSWPH